MGVTRERIRQVAVKYFGTTGNKRLRLRESRRSFPLTDMLKEIKTAAEKHHLTFEVQYYTYKNKNFSVRYGMAQRKCRINGRTCLIRIASPNGRSRKMSDYFSLPAIPGGADFCIIKFSKGSLIVPTADSWEKRTTLALIKKITGGAGQGRKPSHNYDTYVEAWDLFKDHQRGED